MNFFRVTVYRDCMRRNLKFSSQCWKIFEIPPNFYGNKQMQIVFQRKRQRIKGSLLSPTSLCTKVILNILESEEPLRRFLSDKFVMSLWKHWHMPMVWHDVDRNSHLGGRWETRGWRPPLAYRRWIRESQNARNTEEHDTRKHVGRPHPSHRTRTDKCKHVQACL